MGIGQSVVPFCNKAPTSVAVDSRMLQLQICPRISLRSASMVMLGSDIMMLNRASSECVRKEGERVVQVRV